MSHWPDHRVWTICWVREKFVFWMARGVGPGNILSFETRLASCWLNLDIAEPKHCTFYAVRTLNWWNYLPVWTGRDYTFVIRKYWIFRFELPSLVTRLSFLITVEPLTCCLGLCQYTHFALIVCEDSLVGLWWSNSQLSTLNGWNLLGTIFHLMSLHPKINEWPPLIEISIFNNVENYENIGTLCQPND